MDASAGCDELKEIFLKPKTFSSWHAERSLWNLRGTLKSQHIFCIGLDLKHEFEHAYIYVKSQGTLTSILKLIAWKFTFLLKPEKPKLCDILSFVRIRHLPLQILAAWDFNLCWLSCCILSIWLHETIFLSPWHVLQMIQHTHHTIQHYNYLCMKFIQRLNEVHVFPSSLISSVQKNIKYFKCQWMSVEKDL